MTLRTDTCLPPLFADPCMMVPVMTSKPFPRKPAIDLNRALLLCASACLAAGLMMKTAHADQRPAAGGRLRPVSSAPVANRLIFAPATQTAIDPAPAASEPAQQQRPSPPQSTPEIDALQKRKQQTLDELHDKAARLVLLMRQKKALQKQAAEEREAADREKALEAFPLGPVEGNGGSKVRPTDPQANPSLTTDASGSENGNSADGLPQVDDGGNRSPVDGQPGMSEDAGETGEAGAPGQNIPERPLTDRDGTAVDPEDAAGMLKMSPEEFQANPISGPIDRLALATSLFATKQYAGCLKVLDALEKETLSAESQDWCLYMTACCFRKQGALSEAESGYRTIVNQSKTRWLVDASRWWLSHLNDQQKLTEDLTQVNTTLDTWQKEIHAIKNSN